MNEARFHLTIAVVVLMLAVLACAVGAPAPTATPVPPTNTSVLPTDTPVPSATLVPTNTPEPTATPNVAATQAAEKLQSLLSELQGKGYIDTTEGTAIQLDDFSQDWAKLGYYNWYDVRDDPIGDFVYSGHFKWSSAATTNDISGCGIGFGLQENGDHYAVFLDKSRILFQMGRGSYSYNVGVTRGSGRMSFDNPAEADFVLVVKGQQAYLKVNDAYIEYTLSVDQTSSGFFAFSILSGTNRDYGTRCEMTNSVLWTPK